jgi:protein arginine N-methyltransferase 1
MPEPPSSPRVRIGYEPLARIRAATASDNIAFFPSLGEYPVYDTQIYSSFARDSSRNSVIEAAIRQAAPGRIALDIGTGQDALWAIRCAEHGASHVYAVEEIPSVAAHARRAVSRAQLDRSVTVIEGRSDKIALPRRASLCVFEIIGNIAGAEGVEVIIEDAARRLCSSNSIFLPRRCATVIGAISFDKIGSFPGITTATLKYVERIFRIVGHPFDLRLCIDGPARDLLISTTAEVEHLVFGVADSGQTSRTDIGSIIVHSAARIHGLMMWPRLWCTDGPYDSLETGGQSWAPVYAPISLNGIPVGPGDRIKFEFRRSLSDDGVHPDYSLHGDLDRCTGGVLPIEWSSCHHGKLFRRTDFYRYLFPGPVEN